METKFFNLDLEEKALEEGIISGYGSVFNNVDLGNDLVEPGAYKGLKKMPKMLWQHDPAQPIGVWETAVEDEKGLKVRGRLLPELAKGAEVLAMLKHKLIDGLSIGYKAKSYEFKNRGKDVIRHLKEIDLFEISVVTFPMDPKALVTDVKQLQSPREVETILRNAGVPAAFAKLVASHGFAEAKAKLADHRDDGGDEPGEGFALLLKEIQGLKETLNGKG